MKELTLQEIQSAAINVLKKLAEICEENKFEYYLYYGTLIGAIRHKGFIPWDDDIDIAMPRKDYDKLIEYLINKKDLGFYSLIHYKTNADYVYPIARFCDTRYHIECDDVKDYGLGVFVDIYPLDGWGDNEDEKLKLFNKYKLKKILVLFAGMKKYKKSSKGILHSFVKLIIFICSKVIGSYRLIKSMDIEGRKIEYEKSKYVGCVIWASKLACCTERKNLVPVKMQFEDAYFNVPKGYDDILRGEYGDYMKLPSEKDRVAHHYYKAYLKDEFI